MSIVAKKFFNISLMVVLTLIVAISAYGGEYCKWTDENGVVHYDKSCPDDVTSDIVAAEGKRTESQKVAAEEHTKSLLTEPAQLNKSTGKSQKPEPVSIATNSRPQDSKDFSQMSADQLDIICEEEREKRLAPEREQLIQICVTENRNSQEFCESYYSDYGDAQRIAGTNRMLPALYLDIPECVAAFEARKKGN